MTLSTQTELVYPERDGQPMSDNTLQFRWIVLIKENLECLFAENPEVFVAGDLLWYPVEGHPEIRIAPDALVAFGRPKGDRGSYRQWQEGNIAPQVVFEVLSPGNRLTEMARKLLLLDSGGYPTPNLNPRQPTPIATIECLYHLRAPLKTQKSGKFTTKDQGFWLLVFPKMFGF